MKTTWNLINLNLKGNGSTMTPIKTTGHILKRAFWEADIAHVKSLVVALAVAAVMAASDKPDRVALVVADHTPANSNTFTDTVASYLNSLFLLDCPGSSLSTIRTKPP